MNLSLYPVLERRNGDNPWKVAATGESVFQVAHDEALHLAFVTPLYEPDLHAEPP